MKDKTEEKLVNLFSEVLSKKQYLPISGQYTELCLRIKKG